MELKQIYTSDTEYYSFTERLMTESFPANEYRDLCDFRKYTDSNPLFHNNIIFEKEKLLGFITYWDFDTRFLHPGFQPDRAGVVLR